MIDAGKGGFATIPADVVKLSNNSLVREHIESYENEG